MDGNKIVVGLTARDKDADKFWFSLFHELAHIALGHVGQPNGTTIVYQEFYEGSCEEHGSSSRFLQEPPCSFQIVEV